MSKSDITHDNMNILFLFTIRSLTKIKKGIKSNYQSIIVLNIVFRMDFGGSSS